VNPHLDERQDTKPKKENSNLGRNNDNNDDNTTNLNNTPNLPVSLVLSFPDLLALSSLVD